VGKTRKKVLEGGDQGKEAKPGRKKTGKKVKKVEVVKTSKTYGSSLKRRRSAKKVLGKKLASQVPRRKKGGDKGKNL